MLFKLQSLFTIPSTSILGTMDVKSLYTNIDQEEGTDACYKKLETHNNRTENILKSCIPLKFSSFVVLFIYKKEHIIVYLNGWQLCECAYGHVRNITSE